MDNARVLESIRAIEAYTAWRASAWEKVYPNAVLEDADRAYLTYLRQRGWEGVGGWAYLQLIEGARLVSGLSLS